MSLYWSSVSLYNSAIPVLGKRNHSPGQDSITTEFNQVFWPTLGNLLVTVFNESHEPGLLPESQRNSVMSLIFKKDDDEDIANYRPITLTNVDYRILAFTLAQRMQNIMKNIVNTDQSAYIKGRYMGTSIRLVDDVIKYYELASKSGILFMLDFTKAFHTLQWDFMLDSLKYFKF